MSSFARASAILTVDSSDRALLKNADGSVDIYVGPKAPMIEGPYVFARSAQYPLLALSGTRRRRCSCPLWNSTQTPPTRQQMTQGSEKNTDLWKENCPTGPVERPQRFDPLLQGGIFANGHALTLSKTLSIAKGNQPTSKF